MLLVRKQDWEGLDRQLVTGAKLTLSLDGNIDMEELRLFPCILQSPLQLGVEGQGNGNIPGTALLHKDGRISQEVTVPIRCSLYGALSSCKSWNLQDRTTWRTQCTEISNVDVTIVSRDTQEVMKQGLITLNNDVSRKTCCLDPDTFVTVFYQKKSEDWLNSEELSGILPSCHFSEKIQESCNEESGLFELSRLCAHEGIVIKKYSKVSCYSRKIIKDTCNPKYNCDQ